MPIKDLQSNRNPGLSRAGVIRLGFKMRKCTKCGPVRAYDKCPKCGGEKFKMRKQGQNNVPVEYPAQAKHFVLDDAPGVAQALGTSEPAELRIWFPFNDIEQVLPSFYQLWSASSLVCRGDGEKIIYAINPATGRTIIRDGLALEDFKTKDGEGNSQDVKEGDFAPCSGKEKNLYSRCKDCKANALLIALLRDVPRLAYYQISTTSINNIVDLTAQLEYIIDNVGRLKGVPFILKLQEREISAPTADGTGRRRVKKFLLSLEVDPEYYNSLMEMHRQLAAPEKKVFELQPGDVQELPAEPVDSAVLTDESVTIEPPRWDAPNGHDDSGEIISDWSEFVESAIDAIPPLTGETDIVEGMNALNLSYDPANEAELLKALSTYASKLADADQANADRAREIAVEVADSILGTEQGELNEYFEENE